MWRVLNDYLGKWNNRTISKVKTWSYFLSIPKQPNFRALETRRSRARKAVSWKFVAGFLGRAAKKILFLLIFSALSFASPELRLGSTQFFSAELRLCSALSFSLRSRGLITVLQFFPRFPWSWSVKRVFPVSSSKERQCREFAVNLKSNFCILCVIWFLWCGIFYPITSWDLWFYRKIGTLPYSPCRNQCDKGRIPKTRDFWS